VEGLGRVWGGRTDDELDALGGMLIGSPDQVAEKVAALEAIGIDTLLLVCSFGNLSHVQVCQSLELFRRGHDSSTVDTVHC
jgi:alkanesulfonate monooxygenase SsuD/methylene tetrahydromethanopterin reductase-like flavin-dependent oxidoreductase (luciferase family)